MLTDTAIKRATAGDRTYKMGDTGGLFLLVTNAGGKLWRWKYRFEGKEKKMSFGRYPEVTLAEVRVLHAAARRLLAAGDDPMAKRNAEKKVIRASNELPFRIVASQWHEHWKGSNSAHHVKATWSRLEANVFLVIGDRLITEIQAPEIVVMVKAIQDRGKLDIAKRALETTGQIFRFAVAHGQAQRNPVADIKPGDILKSRQKENHARVDAKELPALLRAIEIYQGKHVTRLAIKLLAMTFVRTSELIGAKWEEFDLEASRWNIPAERMKMHASYRAALSAGS
jgi:integrase